MTAGPGAYGPLLCPDVIHLHHSMYGTIPPPMLRLVWVSGLSEPERAPTHLDESVGDRRAGRVRPGVVPGRRPALGFGVRGVGWGMEGEEGRG